MAIISFTCKRHGKSDAYAYKTRHGWTVKRCRKCRREEVAREVAKLRADLISAYGGKCECCGESEPLFLTLDHTNGDGKQHRKAVGRGNKLYKWLAKRGYPKRGYRLLCWNCNCARGQFGTCPHQR